ncbi:Phenylacetate-coenzyme A ligase [Candidatus Methanomarinus sp.]|nr:Phenylacetate-coenzyme A ligase [ANME-2 cluster archaeon]
MLKKEIKKSMPKKISANNLYVRLGNIINTWNVFQHFYPYFDVVNCDWEEEFVKAIKNAYQDVDEKDFKLTLSEMVSALKDGHGEVRLLNESPAYFAPVKCTFVGDEIVIEQCFRKGVDILPGDIILEINSMQIKEIVEEKSKYISAATKGWLRYQVTKEFFRGVKNESLTIKLNRNNKTITRSLKYSLNSYNFGWVMKEQTLKMKKINDNILYVNLDKLSDQDFKQILPNFFKKKCIIFDMRGYPGFYFIKLLVHLMNKKDTSNEWMQIPLVTKPNFRNVEYQKLGWEISPQMPRIEAKIILLSDGRVFSAGDSLMSFIKHYKLGTIIGQPTGGTNGVFNAFFLPGGYQINFTGMKVVNQDYNDSNTNNFKLGLSKPMASEGDALFNVYYGTDAGSRFTTGYKNSIFGYKSGWFSTTGSHIAAESVYVEVVDENNRLLKDKPGRVLITDLRNSGFPMIRYEIGDVATLTDRLCSCGRGLPLLESVNGRIEDFIVTPTGGIISPPAFTVPMSDVINIDDYQIIQYKINSVDILLVKTLKFNNNDQLHLKNAMETMLGKEMTINWKFVDFIDRGISGKRRVIISKVSPDFL